MPSFKLLPDLEIDALVDYVKYLSIRGETERELLRASIQLEEETDVILPVVAKDASAEQKQAAEDQKAAVSEMVG